MFVYFGTNYTSTLVGDTIHAVACDHCGGEYFYTACRIASGVATSPYNIGQKSAQARAGQIAQDKLAESLVGFTDPVPCPRCGRLQARMVADLSSRRYGRWKSATWVVTALVLVPLMLACFIGSGRRFETEVRPKLIALIMLTAGAGAGAWVFVNRLAKEYDPDAAADDGQTRRRVLPPGPPALVRTPWPPQVGTRLAAVKDKEAKTLLMPPAGALQAGGPITSDGAVTVQLQRVGWPDACACCLGPAETTYGDAVPSKGNGPQSPPSLPLCRACGGSLRKRWWTTLFLVAAAFIVGGIAMAYTLPKGPGQAFVAFAMGPILGGAIGYGIANSRTPPHRCRSVDSARGFFAISFRNPDYTRLLIKKWADPETHARVVPNHDVMAMVEGAKMRRRAA